LIHIRQIAILALIQEYSADTRNLFMSQATVGTSGYRRTPSTLARFKGQAEVLKWRLRGRPLPPPHALKVAVISAAAQKHGCSTLIETGTYLGDMVARTRHLFSRVYTIEVDTKLHAQACERFRDDEAVSVLLGDSSKVLPSILEKLSGPAVFWLDGHYSGSGTGMGELETPVQAEVELILSNPIPGHAILVDDARLFNGTNDYPTLEAFRSRLVSLNPKYCFSVENDIIRFVPQ
jgi:hypothetical protein